MEETGTAGGNPPPSQFEIIMQKMKQIKLKTITKAKSASSGNGKKISHTFRREKAMIPLQKYVGAELEDGRTTEIHGASK